MSDDVPKQMQMAMPSLSLPENAEDRSMKVDKTRV